MAKDFAINIGNKDWAHLAGLWHDLGKYHPAFVSFICETFG
ncbi:MAG: hypothetical protein CL877_00565 [Dehalococcoidales bacterium]|nr:hypothetical protein [Dehalococcoidales bacterium]